MLILDQSKKLHEQVTKDMWCKDHFAEDVDGDATYSGSDSACKACVLGLLQIYFKGDEPRRTVAIDRIQRRISSQHVAEFNDNINTTFEDVHQVLKDCDI